MVNKLIFVDKKYLAKTMEEYIANTRRACFVPRNMPCSIFTENEPITMDYMPILELTREQCQIVRDNIVEVVRFADTGRLK